MSVSCPPSPKNKKEYVSELGKILIKEYGKKKYYKPEEVKKAHKKTKWYDGLDFGCWGMSTYSSHSDFDRYHDQTGEVCNYAEMKTEMLQGLSMNDGSNWIDISSFDIDTSWLDFGEVFGAILEGIGDIVSGIFDGL